MSSTIGTPTVVDIYLQNGYFAVLLSGLTALSLYDLKHRRVPNWALAIFIPAALLSLFLSPLHPEPLPAGLLAAAGLLLGGCILLGVAMTTKGGVGGGDIKLCALLGFVAGPFGILVILFLATLLAMGMGGLFKLSFHEKLVNIPFVPFLTMGFMGFYVLNLF